MNAFDLLDDSLVSHYNFDEGSGSTAIDSSLYHNNGVYHSVYGAAFPPTTQWVSGKNGYAFHFQEELMGGGDAFYIRVPDKPRLNLGPGAFTIAFWMQLEDNAAPTDAVLSKGAISDVTFYRNYVIFRFNKDIQNWNTTGGTFVPNNTLQFFTADSSSAPQTALWAVRAKVNSWEHRAIVFSPTGTPDQYTMLMYTNGVLDSTVTKTFTFTAYPGDLLIGLYSLAFAADPSYVWHGSLDDLRIYNRALPAADIKRLYDAFR